MHTAYFAMFFFSTKNVKNFFVYNSKEHLGI